MENEKIKGLVFDLDGTLVNTGPQIAGICNDVMALEGRPALPLESILKMTGDGARMLIERLCAYHGVEDVDKVHKEYLRRFLGDLPAKEDIYPGIHHMLRSLKDRGYKLAVCTNKPESVAKRMMHLFFPGIFTSVIGDREGRPRKPDPTGVLETLEEWNILPQEAIFVGDTHVDIQTGENAGMTTLGAVWGFEGEQVLREAGVKFLLKKPEDLIAMLDEKERKRNE